jgi:hypothetical protein
MNTTEAKQMVFRIPDDLRKDFHKLLIEKDVSIQNTFHAFVETFVAYHSGEKLPDAIKVILRRAETLGSPV